MCFAYYKGVTQPWTWILSSLFCRFNVIMAYIFCQTVFANPYLTVCYKAQTNNFTRRGYPFICSVWPYFDISCPCVLLWHIFHVHTEETSLRNRGYYRRLKGFDVPSTHWRLIGDELKSVAATYFLSPSNRRDL